jgi:hypothetical protein
LGKLRREQESHGIHRKCPVKWINERSVRMSTMKKKRTNKPD